MLRTLGTILLVPLTVYLGLCAVLYFAQRSLMYFPQPRHNTAAVTLKLAADDAQVLATVQYAAGSDAVIYFGGNAEDVSGSLPDLAAAFPGHSLYLMYYRGYGGNPGSPSESALFADARLLFDDVAKKHPHITVVGRSLGSGVATYLASLRPVQRLVLVTPYNSMQELAAQRFPYFPVRWLLRDRFESWKYAEKIAAPTAIIMAAQDEVIPEASTRALFGHFRANVATLAVVRGARHNTISASPDYIRLLSAQH